MLYHLFIIAKTKKFIFTFLVLLLVVLTTYFGTPDQTPKQLDKNKQEKNEKPLPFENDPAAIYLNAKVLYTNLPEVQNARNVNPNFSGKKMHLVKFKDAIQPSYYAILKNAGAEIIDYIPNYAYLVFVDFTSLQKIKTEGKKENTPIQWDGAYEPAYRLMPDLFATDAQTSKGTTIQGTQFLVQLYKNDVINSNTINLLQQLQGVEKLYTQSIAHYINIVVNTSGANVSLIAQQEDVISIHPYITPKKRDESQGIILSGQMTAGVPNAGLNYLTYLTNAGFTQAQFDASNFAVNIVDGGLDSGSVGGVLRPTRHFALHKNGDKAQATRVAFIRGYGTFTDVDTKGCEGHGNINSHIVGGYVPNSLIGTSSQSDANSFRYGLGIAPFVKVANSTIFRGPANGGSYTNPTFSSIESESYRDGGRISSNSWGANTGGAYNADCQAYDFLVRDAQPTGALVAAAGNQEMAIVFSAGNSGSAANTIGSPGAAKNVICVAAGEGVRAFGGADGCGEADADANNANDMAVFSSRGPCDDGRVKPDITLPGTHITGGVFPNATNNATNGNGAASTCFDGSGVCGGVASNFFPSTQQWYSSSSGTSHSCPAIAGMAALVRQFFINKGLTAPSAAMTKASIMQSATFMTGLGTSGNLPNNNQGMGLANINNTISTLNNPYIVRDQVTADIFTASNQTNIRTGTIADNTKPVRITLAYTDAPGSTTGNAYVNNLDLEITINGNVYLGNVFSNQNSVTGGVADVRNNVESVFLPAGTTGNISIKVKATNIAGDGVPNFGTTLDQDYALLVSNVTEVALAIPGSTGPVVTNESCGSGLILDPSEQITVSLPITNNGSISTTNLVATLQANSGVVSPSAAQSYGALASNATLSRSFLFFVNSSVPCGSTITLNFNLTDGATNLGTITRVINIGGPSTLIAQNFDGVTAPALPLNFTQNQITGTAINWVTSTTTPNSAPNVVFANNPATVNLTALETTIFTVNTATSTVSFQKAYTTESGYDGVVLEIKIGAGAWTDIITAGGSFSTGGYTNALNTGFGNPLPGRQAWTGTSTTYTSTVANLPASANGQNVQLRWVMGSDNSTASTGFRLDNIIVTGANVCTTCSTLPLTLLSFNGSKENGYNKLLWKTSNEVNTKLFEVEYSVDGVNFSKGYTLAAVGNGNNAYVQKDNGSWIKNALVYYRLKIIDKDGRFNYSTIINIRNTFNGTLTSSLYPNPVDGIATLSITDKNLIGTTALLLDAKGSKIKEFKLNYNTNLLDVHSYASGNYVIQLNNGEVLKLQKK